MEEDDKEFAHQHQIEINHQEKIRQKEQLHHQQKEEEHLLRQHQAEQLLFQEEQQKNQGEEEQQIPPGDGQSHAKMKSPRADLHPAIHLSSKANNHLRVSEKANECTFEMNADVRKNARDIKRRSKHFLLHNQQDFNEVQHAPSAHEHRHERVGIDAVIAELMEDRRELHYNFSELFSP